MNVSPRRLEVFAPLSGILFPLDIVPDPVFAQKMVGDGISLDPLSGEVLAPVDGVITQLHKAHHALTITTPEGVEVLVHVGVDTVLLKGEGFQPLISVGDSVSRGQRLVNFDVNLLALKAPSCLTQIVITNGEKIARIIPADGEVRAGRDVVLTLELPETALNAAGVCPCSDSSTAEQGVIWSEAIGLPNPVGLHARPAAVLATEARKLEAEVFLCCREKEANARSIVAMLSLDTRQGDVIRIRASGPQAAEAVARLGALLQSGCGDDLSAGVVCDGQEAPSAVLHASNPDGILVGVAASIGIVQGPVFRLSSPLFDVQEHVEETVDQELARLQGALRLAQEAVVREMNAQESPTGKAIFQAHLEMLDDSDILDLAQSHIAAGKSAAFAWLNAFEYQAERLSSMPNALLRERAADVRDIGRSVLAYLAPRITPSQQIPQGCIVIATELTPSETMRVARSRAAGFCTIRSTPASHASILARLLGMPAVCCMDERAWKLHNGRVVTLNGQRGILDTNPLAPTEH